MASYQLSPDIYHLIDTYRKVDKIKIKKGIYSPIIETIQFFEDKRLKLIHIIFHYPHMGIKLSPLNGKLGSLLLVRSWVQMKAWERMINSE